MPPTQNGQAADGRWGRCCRPPATATADPLSSSMRWSDMAASYRAASCGRADARALPHRRGDSLSGAVERAVVPRGAEGHVDLVGAGGHVAAEGVGGLVDAGAHHGARPYGLGPGPE